MTESEAQSEGPRIKVDPTKDLWQNIVQNVKETAAGETQDLTVLIVGAKGSGKSSVIHRVQGSTSKTKPTTALEYSFGKRDDRNATQIAHFWELAQGAELSQLSDIVVTPENIHTVVVAIVVDCHDVSTMFESATFWLKRIDCRAQEIFQKMKAKSSQTPDKMLARARRLVGEDHPDLAKMRLSGIPTVIICNRLDIFKDDSTRLKMMAKTMRHVAHLYGAHLVFTSEQSQEVTKLRTVMNHLIFQLPFDSRLLNMDPERGSVVATPDKDSFRDIGDPYSSNMADFVSKGDADLDRWNAAMDSMFPPKKAETKGEDPFLKNLYAANGFAEPTIDSMRKQKDEELEQYRRSVSKKSEKKSEKEDREG